MSLLLKLLISFLIQSFIFFILAKKMNEDPNTLWDIYFATNIPSVILSLILSHFIGIFFPLYFFSLMFMFYFVKARRYQDKSLKTLFLYFSINVYSGILLFFLLNLNLNITWIVPFIFISLFLFLVILFRKIYIGMYLLPLVYLGYLFYENPTYLHIFINAFSGQLANHIALIEMGFIILGMFIMLFAEYRYNHFVFKSDEQKEEFEKILRYRKLSHTIPV